MREPVVQIVVDRLHLTRFDTEFDMMGLRWALETDPAIEHWRGEPYVREVWGGRAIRKRSRR